MTDPATWISWVSVPHPLITFSNGDQLRFNKMERGGFERNWDPVDVKRSLVIPRGANRDTRYGFRLSVMAKFSMLLNVEHKPNAGSWAAYPGLKALALMAQEHKFNFQPNPNGSPIEVVAMFGLEIMKDYSVLPDAGMFELESTGIHTDIIAIEEDWGTP